MVWNPSRLKPKMMEAIEVFWLKVPLKITKAQILETLTKPLICITWIVWRNWGLKPASIKVQWWPLRQPVVSDPPILTPPVIIAFQQPHRPRLNLIVQEAIILSQPVRPIPNQHPQLWQPRVNNLVEILMWILFVKDWSELDEITEWWFWIKIFLQNLHHLSIPLLLYYENHSLPWSKQKIFYWKNKTCKWYHTLWKKNRIFMNKKDKYIVSIF